MQTLRYHASTLHLRDDLARSPSDHRPRADFPQILWQTAPNKQFIERWQAQLATWLDLNADWRHVLLDDTTMDDFVTTELGHRPDILGFWRELQVPILRTDLFRYLALLSRGGVYSDMDTTNLKAIGEWIPRHLRSESINVVAGLEYADTTYRIFPRNISFCQWTLMAKPGHPVYEYVGSRVISRLEYIARVQKVPIGGLRLNREEILAATGPGVYSDAILAAVRHSLGDSSLNWNVFFGLQEPTLFGDILVLPINAFGSGQKHSNSSKAGWGDVLVKHHFGSSWFKKRPHKKSAYAEHESHQDIEAG